MRPPKQRQPKTGVPLIAGHDFSQRLYVPLKSMLDWQALLKKTGTINFRVGSARRVKKIAIISCGFKKPCYDGRLC
jgi:hypothetical protein